MDLGCLDRSAPGSRNRDKGPEKLQEYQGGSCDQIQGRQKRKPLVPGALKIRLSTLHSVPSFQMYVEPRSF